MKTLVTTNRKDIITLFEIGGFDIRILEILDVIIFGYLIYIIYNLVKGTIAFNIFIGAIILYSIYTIVNYLDMRLLSTLLGKFVGYGVLILIILFTAEIRKFLLLLGDTTLKGRLKFLDQFFGEERENDVSEFEDIAATIAEASFHLCKTKTGALLVVTHEDIPQIASTGTMLDANVNSMLLESIFFKNSPLHDGAVLLKIDKIIAASCILPVSKKDTISKDLGLRHRAAIGVSEAHITLAVIVSEETGEVSTAYRGKINRNLSPAQLKTEISEYFKSK